jgi:uncharacterized membrane protein
MTTHRGQEKALSTDDKLVSEYLRRLEEAAAILPPDRRAELLDEITTHIADARATEPAAATVLDRLGSPADIVRAAAAEQGMPESPEVNYASVAMVTHGLGWQETSAIVLLLVGGFLAGIGWLAGVFLLWLSPRWRVTDKLLGTLVWPGGLAAVAFLAFGAAGQTGACAPRPVEVGRAGHVTAPACTTSGGLPTWSAVALLVLGIAGPAVVAWRLARQAQRPPREAAAPTVMLQR